MSRVAAFVSGAAVATAAAALLVLAAPSRDDDEAGRWRARALEAEARIGRLREELARRPPAARAPEAPAAPEPPPAGAPAPDEAPRDQGVAQEAPLPPPSDLPDRTWEVLVTGALRSEVQRLGHTLTPEQETRLLDRLRAVREAGLAIDAAPAHDGLTSQRQRLARSIVLLQADRAFREELGIGVSDFLAAQGSQQVEEALPVEPAPEQEPRGNEGASQDPASGAADG